MQGQRNNQRNSRQFIQRPNAYIVNDTPGRSASRNASVGSGGGRSNGSDKMGVLLLPLALIIFAVAIFCSSSAVAVKGASVTKLDLSTELGTAFDNLASDAVQDFFELQKSYVLPLDLSPAPEADDECYSTTEANGITYDIYEDPTITVKMWREHYPTATVNFAEITVASATQLRTAFAGGSYNMNSRERPYVMATTNNAIVATNCDFYNFHSHGIIIRQGTVYRNVPTPWEICLIDSEGDFHVGNYREIMNAEILDNYTIYNSFNFGPILVNNGEKKIRLNMPVEVEDMRVPRTAIGQLGTRHYLLMAADGNSKESAGLYVNEVADIMLEKGCSIAYNLDGGHSTAMIFHDEIYSKIAYDGQRLMGDIVYFATAVPDGN